MEYRTHNWSISPVPVPPRGTDGHGVDRGRRSTGPTWPPSPVSDRPEGCNEPTVSETTTRPRANGCERT